MQSISNESAVMTSPANEKFYSLSCVKQNQSQHVLKGLMTPLVISTSPPCLLHVHWQGCGPSLGHVCSDCNNFKVKNE